MPRLDELHAVTVTICAVFDYSDYIINKNIHHRIYEVISVAFQALYMVPVVLSVAMIAAFQLPAFTERQNLGAVTLLLVLFGSAYIRVPLPPEIFLSQDRRLIRTSQC